MKKTVLVTGGAGFLGSHLCESLCKAGHNVICLDNLSTGTYDNIKLFETNPLFRFIKSDVENMPVVNVDEIYNLACPASPRHYQKDPVKTIKTNYEGMLKVLEIARINDARVIQASTSEIYGDPLVHPQGETYTGNVNTVGPRACYDEGKRIAETLCYSYREMYNIQVGIVRIFNTYGPRMRADDGRVVSNFILQALKGKDITIYGDGYQTRSFCYIDDLINGLQRMMAAENFFGPVNLGNPVETSMLELAQIIIELTKSKSKLCFPALPQDDPVRRKPDISLAEEVLGWKPQISLQDGLYRTIQYMNENI